MNRSGLVLFAACVLAAYTGRLRAVASDADQLLDAVIARLPKDPMKVTGELVVRRRHGLPVGRFGFEMQLDWGSRPSTAVYDIRDAFGGSLERLTVVRENGAAPLFKYASGDPLRQEEMPPLFDTIQFSDISWVDLALTFLWWKDGKLAGSDEVKGRKCHIVEVPAPVGTIVPDTDVGTNGETGTPYAAVRLWIDRELLMLLQAEGLDASGNLVRKLWVKSFKKINDRWMIKDMEVQTYPVKHRTKLVIREVTADAPL